jgi:F-type H+-transporting ATPase subunit b
MRLLTTTVIAGVIAGILLWSGTSPVLADEIPGKQGSLAPSSSHGDSSVKPKETTAQQSSPGSTGHHGHEADKLGFLGLKRYDLGIYTLVVFGLLVWILSKYAWPHIREGLEKREANIRAALAEAQKERDEAKMLLVQAKKQLDEAAIQVRAMLEEARRDAEALRLAEREAGVKEAAAERERARREIAAARDAALAEIYDRAVELAALLSSKTLARTITPDDHRRLLEEAVAELQRTNPTAA